MGQAPGTARKDPEAGRWDIKEENFSGKDLEQHLDVLARRQNQKAFHLVWKRAKKLVRYVLPKKVQGRIHFGFDDPYDTGQVLTMVSPFYGLYARTLTLEPDFTGTALDGELHFKGRIALWYPLWTAARLFISKDFRRLLRFFEEKRIRGTKKA